MTARANIERALRAVDLDGWVVIVSSGEDRVKALGHPGLQDELIRRGWTVDPFIDPVHAEAEISLREPNAVMPSLQFCYGCGLWDIDLDFANPIGGDVASAVVHGAEWLWHKLTRTKTNPARMAKALDRRFGRAQHA